MKAKLVKEETQEFKRGQKSVHKALDVGVVKNLATAYSYWNEKNNEEAVIKIQEEIDELHYAIDHQLLAWANPPEDGDPYVNDSMKSHPRQAQIQNRFHSIENELEALIELMKSIKTPE